MRLTDLNDPVARPLASRLCHHLFWGQSTNTVSVVSQAKRQPEPVIGHQFPRRDGDVPGIVVFAIEEVNRPAYLYFQESDGMLEPRNGSRYCTDWQRGYPTEGQWCSLLR